MMDKRKCLLCGHYQVYVEHITKDETWRFFCRHCGRTTGYFSTHDEAEKEWEQIEGGTQHDTV